MAQTFTSTDVTTETNVFGDNKSQRTNENTLRSNFSGATQPSDPVVGQQWYDTSNNKTWQYNGTAWVAIDTNSTTQIDVSNAKGNLTNLTSYLRVAHNDDGTLKETATTSIDEFKDNTIVITYVSSSSFTVPTDLTAIFTVGRKLKVYLSSSTFITYVTASYYSSSANNTTVTINSTALDSSVTSIKYSMIQYGMPYNIDALVSKATADSAGNVISSTYLPLSGGTMTGGLTYSNGTNAFHLTNAYNNLQFVLDNDDITLYDAGKDRFAFTYSQSRNTVQIGNSATAVSIPGTVGLTGINMTGNILFSNSANQSKWENSYNSTGFVLYSDGMSMYDWGNNRIAVQYQKSTNTITVGNSAGTNVLAGTTNATLSTVTTIGGYTAAQLLAASSKVVAVQQVITWSGALTTSGVAVGTWNPPTGYTREQCVAIAVPSSGCNNVGNQIDMVYASTETDGRVILRSGNTWTITYEVRVLVVAIK